MIKTIAVLGSVLIMCSCSPRIAESTASSNTNMASSAQPTAQATSSSNATTTTNIEMKGAAQKDMVPSSAPATIK